MMRILFTALLVFIGSLTSALSQENEIVWVQIEAQPSLTVARDRIQQYAREVEDVNGFSLGGGWYAIVLGPYTPEDAETVLRVYREERVIPRDSFIAFTSAFRAQFWPVGANLLTTLPSVAESSSIPETTSSDDPVETAETQIDDSSSEPEETPRQARASEAALSREERKELQVWLKWAGFYNSAIDGAFGRGTRRSMAEWQSANAFDPTGVLTTRQRKVLKNAYFAVLKGLDLQTIADLDAGIEVQIPTGVVAKSKIEFPFVHYDATGDVDAKVLLISQKGDQATLFGLYEIMQTLEIVPLEGPRERRKDGFVLIGEDGHMISHTEVTLKDGEIKGFTLAWPAGDEERRRRVLNEMQKSFGRIGGALDPAASSETVQNINLLAGLEIRQPKISRSGFFINQAGVVVTTSEVVQQCGTVTLEGDYPATVITNDTALGVAILRPVDTLAPMNVAQLRDGTPRLQSEVAVSGYSFEGVLGAPTLTFGRLEDVQGLRGENHISRLSLTAQPGDAGGPVFDATGAVVGMLLPASSDTTQQLPKEVSFVVAPSAIQSVMKDLGISHSVAAPSPAIAPEDLTILAAGTTVLVSCWE